MIPGTSSCFPSINPQGSSYGSIYQAMEDVLFSPASAAAAASADMTSSHALLCSLSVLKDKVQQLESFASIMIPPNPTQLQESMAMVQEIIFVASSISCALQQVAPSNTSQFHPPRITTTAAAAATVIKVNNQSSSKAMECSLGGNNFFHDGEFNFSSGNSRSEFVVFDNGRGTRKNQRESAAGKSEEAAAQYDVIIELDAADLLAKYTNYCHVCGKGFRRDANLRMHMRAHGDEYKSAAALSNPTKGGGGGQRTVEGRKYSCPHEGCRWNRKHAKFQPLKSVVCVKNHYKRSHCPKMYVCNRCGVKQFSVLSDLRTHEKHCGDLRWRCSCGTNFSRKDKLMGHVALFAGHTPEPI